MAQLRACLFRDSLIDQEWTTRSLILAIAGAGGWTRVVGGPQKLRYLFLLLSLLAGALRAQSPGPGTQLGRRCWQANRPLTWHDFQAPTRPQPADATWSAYIAPDVVVTGYVDAAQRNNFRVRVSLDPQQCWVADSTAGRAALTLAHEQLHFDIGELVARQLRQHIAQVYQAGEDVFSPAFSREIQAALAEFDQLQQAYDQQTDHGTQAREQRQWTQRVRRELALLSAYQSTDATCRPD